MNVSFRHPVGLGTMILCLIALGSNAQEPPASASRPLAADPEAAALAGFDEETGLWFPPDRTREEYLANLGGTKYMMTVLEIMKTDRRLGRAICALMADPKRETRWTTLPQQIKQTRTMTDMACSGFQTNEQDTAADEARWQDFESNWAAWMNLEAARTLDPDERRAKAMSHVNEVPANGSEAQMRAAFGLLGLSPQSETALLRVLKVVPYHDRVKKRSDEILERLFSREGAEGMPDASLFRMARRHFLLHRGSYAEALALSRTFENDARLDPWKLDNQIVLGILERIAGNRAPLDAVLKTCPTPEPARKDLGGAPGTYCIDMAAGIATRNIDQLVDKASPQLVDLLEDLVRAEPTNWPRRLDAIRHVALLDSRRARAMAEELLQVPATISPEAARIDALTVVGSTSRKLKEYPRAQKAYDRFLDMFHYKPLPIRPDLWSLLTAVPKEPPTGEAHEHAGWNYVTETLSAKIKTAIEANDFEQAKRFIEQYLAFVFFVADAPKGDASALEALDLSGITEEESKQLRAEIQAHAAKAIEAPRAEARYARYQIGELAVAYSKAGRLAEAKSIIAYLLKQPDGETRLPFDLALIYYPGKNSGKPIEPADRPWEGVGPLPSAKSVKTRMK